MEKSDLQRFRNECVAAHNFYRAAHGTPPLCWSTRLEDSAQSWAQHLASSGSPRYSSEKDIGENFVCLWGSELNGQKVTRIWYEEGKYFDYNKPRVNSRTRSFCQVVWEGTREVGAGAAVTKYGKQIVVARYFPPINKKDVAKNVKKARSTQDNEQPLAYDTRWSRLYLGLKEFHEECLSVHNEYRLRHGAAPLHWSAELAWEAQQWAENLARSGELRHNDDDTVGENLAGMMGGELTGRETTDMWYDEIEDYDFDNAGYSEDTSNFSQVVWVASETLGVGRAIDGDLCVVVAFYEPPGNMEGSFADNVLRMGSAVRERKTKELKGFIRPPPDLESFRLECLVTHNYFRARHGSSPLVLSSVLTDEAQYWAERLLVTGAMEGLDNSRIGISVAVLDKAHISGIKVSELWYKEILNYDFDSPGFSNETLDFSQLVWLSSRKLGVGKATGAEGVTVVVARYEPVGNIDGMFVQNVKRRGHERGSCEPMIFHVEYRYRVRTDSKSTNSFLSWENEDTQTFGELEGDTTKRSCQAPQGSGLTRAKFLLNRLLEDLDRCRNSCYLSPPLSTAASLSWSDLDQFDENENILHRADEQESPNTLTVSDHFTRLVWIDPNSPTLQRKGVAEETTQEEDDDEPEDEREQEEEEEDARTAYEMDNASEEDDLTCVTEEPLIHTEEAELEEADLFSDPEDDLYQHFCEIRRSLSLDSDGTEPELHKGNVLSKIAFFETYQHGTQSPSNSESSNRRSLIQGELEELVSLKKRQSLHKEDEREEEEEIIIMEEEHECQLEFDDVFPAHREGDEEEAHVEIFDDEGEDEDESLISVSDAEDVLDNTDYDTRHEGLQDYEFEDSVCVTHEFVEEPSAMEIFDFSDEDASHQYADITEEEGQPLSSTKTVYASTKLSTASEFQKTETFKLCEDEPLNLTEDASDNYSEERFETSEAVIEVPQASFQKPLDPEFCYLAAKQDHTNSRMEDLISRMGLSSVEGSEGASDEIPDFHGTTEGKSLENLINNRNDREQQYERTPVEEICEAFLKDSVESEIDFEALFKRLENDETETEKAKTIQETSLEIPETTESVETVHVVLRDHESERTVSVEQVGVNIGLVLTSASEEEQESEPDISLDYECKFSTPVDSVELVRETSIESVRRDRPPESVIDLKELQVRVESSIEKEEAQEEITQDKTDTLSEDQSCEAVLRDYGQERAKCLEETGLELDLVTVSSDITHSFDKPVEPLYYNHAPKSSTVIELPEIAEHIEAEVRRDVQSEIDFEEMFRRLEEDDTTFADEAAKTRHLEEAVTETSQNEETLQASLNVEENWTVDEVVRCNLSSSEYISHDRRQNEPTDEIIEVEQAEQRRPASLYMDESTVVEDIVTEPPSSPKCIAGEGVTLERTEAISEVNELLEEQRASLFVEEDSIVNEVVRDTPPSQQHIAGESRSVETFDEIHEEATEEGHRASVFLEEDTLVDVVGADTLSSPKYIAGESLQAEFFEEINEEPIEEGKRASVFFEVEQLVDEVTTDTPSSPKHIACQSREAESFDEVNEEPMEENKRASLFFEGEPLVDEVVTDTPSSPKHIAGESRQAESFDEVNEEPIEEGKRASVFFEVEQLVDEVTTDTPSSPKHIAGQSREAESFDEVNEEPMEENKRASLFFEGEPLVDEVVTDTPSSPKHIAGESRQAESFDEVNEEPIEENKRASLLFEVEPLVDEVVTDTPSSPKHIAGESRQAELFDEVNEEPMEESKRASLFFEVEPLVNEVAADTPSSPKHIAGENLQAELFDEVNEEPMEESIRASLFFEGEPLVDEVTTDTPSSPKHIAGVSRQAESFDEINEELIEESKRASVFFEVEPLVDKVTTDTPSSPKHIAGVSRQAESFDAVNKELIEESKRASVFFEVEPLVDEVVADTPSSPKHIAMVTRQAESFDEVNEEPIEENKRASLFFEVEPLVDEVVTDTPSSPKHIAGESRQAELFDEVNEEPMEESKRASLFFEVEPLVDEVAADTPSSPKHIAGENLQAELFDEVNEEPMEESIRASLFFEGEPLVDEVTTDTPSSPKHIAGVSRQAESFDEINEELIEESKRASVFFEVEPLVDKVTTDTPSSPKHIAGVSRQAESFDAVNKELIEESKRASVFFEVEPLVDEVVADTPSSPKHIAMVTRQAESFDEINEELIEESKRASVFFEVEPLVDEVVADTPSSPKHIATVTRQAESFDEINEELIEESKRASVFFEVEPLVDEVVADTPSSPKHIAGESLQAESFDEVNEETIEESKRASLFFEVEPLVDEVTTGTPSSPEQIVGESRQAESFEEIKEEPIEESKRATLFFEVEPLVEEVSNDTPSSPKHIAGEEHVEESERALLFSEEDTDVVDVETGAPSSPKHIAGESWNAESFEEVDEDPTKEGKRASLFLEEDSIVDEIETKTSSTPNHITGERLNIESFEEVDEEPSKESRQASLYVKGGTDVVEAETDTPSSPKHTAGESRNIEWFEEVEEEHSEESKQASMFVEEDTLVDELISDIPSPPKHLAGESVPIETFEEVAEVPSDENKRVSLFVQEDSSVDEVTITTPSVSIHIAGEAFNISTVEEIHEEATPDVEHARELEEAYDEASYDYVSLEIVDQNDYVTGEFTSSELLEVTADDESPESDFGEQFEEFESICGTQRFIDPSQSAHIAGEIKNIDTHDETLEQVLQVEESLAYEETQEMITTTQILKTSQPSFHVAGELSNAEPQEESSEEEKPDEGAWAEEIEETEVQTTTVVLTCPQSLLSIAAAALELKIDAAQQEATEVVETRTEIVQHYDEQEQTEVPGTVVSIADEVLENDEDNAYYVEEEPQDEYEIETERYEDNGEAIVSHSTEDQEVSRSHVTAEFCESEFTLEIEDVEERREFAEPFEESEEGSASELMSECSSSPLHVSSEFRDFQDYETINEEYGTETYHAIPYEESDYLSEKSVSKGFPSLYITEELSPQAIYEENVLNEKSVVIETAQAYHEVEEPLETETSFDISEPPLQTAPEFSDSDYHAGAEENDDLSERDFLEEFEEMEEVFGREVPLTSPKEPALVVSEKVRSGPRIAEEEELEEQEEEEQEEEEQEELEEQEEQEEQGELGEQEQQEEQERGDELLDETDNAQLLATQEPLVGIEYYTRTVEQERSVLKEEKLQEEVWEIEVKEGSRVFEPNEEKGSAREIQKFTVVSQTEQRSVEIKSTGCQVVESKETEHKERIFMGEKAKQMETSYEFEQKVEVLATKTTRQVSSTNSYVATGFASEEIRYKAEKNGDEGILHEEVKRFHEVSFTPIHQTSEQTSWEKEENVLQFETTDELSESVLEKEAKDQESEKFEKQLSEDETEVRLLKSEVMEYKAAEQQTPLTNPHVTVERETTFVKTFIVHSTAKDSQEIQQVVTQDDVLVILKDDEASLEEESAGEQFEEEIDIMRMDEALSEEEFRGEGVESIDRSQSRSSKAESADEKDKSDREEESDVYEGDQPEPIYEEEVEISEVRPIHEQAQKEGSLEEVNQPDREEESDVREGYQQEPLFEEEVEISEVHPSYEEELEMQKVQEQVETSPEANDSTVQASTFEEEVSACELREEPVKENLELEPVETTELRTHSPAFEEELEMSAFQEVQDPAEKVESSAVSTVYEEEVDILASREPEGQGVSSKDEEHKITDDAGVSERRDDDESPEHVETKPRRQPLDLSQVDLYEDNESATTRYYVELSSTESLEPAYEEVEHEATYTETYVRQGDPLEENLEEFILVRYSDDFESSGEEDISDHREIYVIPEEENDVESNVVESARDELKAEKEPVPEGFFEEGFENMALEEIRESPEFEIDDSPEDELDEEEQRQLEEYERLESFVILEEKLSQVESDEDCDEENAGFHGEEGDEDVFHSDVHSSSEETLHEDELGETMTSSSIRQAAVSTEVQSKEEEKADYQISSEHQEHSEDSPSREEEEEITRESFAESSVEETCSEKGDKEDVSLSKEPAKEKDVSESRKTKDEKTEQSISSDSSGEQSISSEGSLSSTPSVDLEGVDDFEQNCLLEHNLYRRQHRVKPLKWSGELAADAKEWAEHMASVNCLERCDGKAVGQNLVSVHGKDLNGSEVVEMWYKEATDYNFEVPAYNAKCGNFTQVVWASSREFGVAKCVADDGTQYVAALYKPAGNIVGEFKDNVKAPRDSSGRLKRRRSSAKRRSRSGLPPVTPAEREKFKTECVISHNYYRTFHNAPPLRWSPLLAAEAQNYAERLVKTNSLTHSGQKDRGENLAYTWDSSLSARGAVDMWYDEVQDYDFDCPGYTSDTSHFTQLVWVGTEEFGMGMAVAPDGRNVVVGRYFPPGNIVGQFNENVRPREIAGIP